MFDHITLTVADVPRAVRFYRQALEPLGFSLEQEYEGGAGFGTAGVPQLWLQEGVASKVHIAFSAASRKAVAAFHGAALASGGTDNGAPAPRESYGPTYYAAFVHDPDGNNVEAVTQGK